MTISFGSNKLIVAGDMSRSFQSEAISLHRKEEFCIDSIFTGAPVGTMYLSVSVDNVTFSLLADSTVAISAAGNVMYNVCKAGYSWVKLQYVFTSGTGSCNSFFNTKGEI